MAPAITTPDVRPTAQAEDFIPISTGGRNPEIPGAPAGRTLLRLAARADDPFPMVRLARRVFVGRVALAEWLARQRAFPPPAADLPRRGRPLKDAGPQRRYPPPPQRHAA